MTHDESNPLLPARTDQIELPSSLLQEIGNLLGRFLAKDPNPDQRTNGCGNSTANLLS